MQDESKNPDEQDGEKPLSLRESPNFWAGWLKGAKAKAKSRHWDAAKRAWEEFEFESLDGEGTSESTGESPRPVVYPAFWSAVRTLQPAYYSKTPIPVSNVRFGMNDDVARTGAKVTERLGEYTLETSPFDSVLTDAVMDYIIADIAVTRVRLEGEEKEKSVEVPLERRPEGYFANGSAEPVTEGVMQREYDDGRIEFFHTQPEKYFENLKCSIEHVPYDDFLFTPRAKCWEEVDEVAFRFCYSEDEARAMFPDRAEDLPLKIVKDGSDRDISAANNEEDKIKERYVKGWEIWDKKAKTVRWIADDEDLRFLKTEADPYKLRGFFPCPEPIIGTKRRKSMHGRPAYKYLAPFLEQLQEVVTRTFRLCRSIRRRFVVDGKYENDIKELIDSAEESEYFFISNLHEIVEKGGLQNIIQSLPTGELSQALVELVNLLEAFEAKFEKLYGLPDVLRGESDPLDAAKTQMIKSFHATNRFRYQMNQVAKLARDTLELIVDLKLNAYQGEELAQICGAKHMDDADKQRFGQALVMLANDTERVVRIDIETDSTSYINEMIEQQNMNVTAQTVTQGLEKIAQMPPMFQAVGLKLLLTVLSGQRKGKQFQDDIEGPVQQLMQMAQQPPQTPPDYEGMKLQQKQQKDLLDYNIKNTELALKSQKQQMDAQNEALKLQLTQQAEAFSQWAEQVRIAMEQAGLEIEQFKASIQGQETMMEETRLAAESEARMIEAFKPAAEPAPAPPAANITIVNGSPQPEPEILPVPVPVDPLDGLI